MRSFLSISSKVYTSGSPTFLGCYPLFILDPYLSMTPHPKPVITVIVYSPILIRSKYNLRHISHVSGSETLHYSSTEPVRSLHRLATNSNPMVLTVHSLSLWPPTFSYMTPQRAMVYTDTEDIKKLCCQLSFYSSVALPRTYERLTSLDVP